MCEISNYVNDITIYGLMNKNCFFNEDSSNSLSFYKVKNKSKVTICKDRVSADEEKKYDYISYMYLDEKPDIKGARYVNMVTSYISKEYFTGMPGKKYIDIRHTVNQLQKKISAVEIIPENMDDVLDMIEKWRYDDNGGMKYRMREHAGIDKNIIRLYGEGNNKLADNTFAYAFYYGTECIGYACMSNNPNGREWHYLTRKVRNYLGLRNLTEYVDWFMFNQVYRKCNEDFLINWGCSDGGVYWYKTHKWPVYKIVPKWFVTYYPNGKPVKSKTK